MSKERCSRQCQEAKVVTAMATHTANREMGEACTAQAMLFELEVEQLQHDEVYHREIARLSLHHRLNHMALHFAKYTGKVASTTSMGDVIPDCVDTLIIAISTSNILNVRMWEMLGEGEQEYAGLLAYGRSLASRLAECIASPVHLAVSMAVASGKMAAACEKIDHLEEIPTRGEVKSAVAGLAALSLAAIAASGIDPVSAVRERLGAVKKKSKLHGRM